MQPVRAYPGRCRDKYKTARDGLQAWDVSDSTRSRDLAQLHTYTLQQLYSVALASRLLLVDYYQLSSWVLNLNSLVDCCPV